MNHANWWKLLHFRDSDEKHKSRHVVNVSYEYSIQLLIKFSNVDKPEAWIEYCPFRTQFLITIFVVLSYIFTLMYKIDYKGLF